MQNNNSKTRRRTKQTQNEPEPEPKRETVYPNDNHESRRRRGRGRIQIIELPILSEANRISVLFYLSGCLCRSLKCFCFGFCSLFSRERVREGGRRVARPRSGSTSCCQLWKCKMPGRVSSLTFDKDVNRNWQQDQSNTGWPGSARSVLQVGTAYAKGSQPPSPSLSRALIRQSLSR